MKEEEITRPIVCTPGNCSGSPRIEGTRLTCANVIHPIAFEGVDGMRKTQAWEIYNEATLIGCVTYCAERRCVQDRPANFCYHCLLDIRRLEEDGSDDDDSTAMWRFAQAILQKGVMTPGGISSEQSTAIESVHAADDRESRAIWSELGLEPKSDPP